MQSPRNPIQKNKIPHIINFTIPGIDSESLILQLENFAISTGASCQSKQKSHVLQALNKTSKEINSSFRVSLGRFTTEEEIEIFSHKLINKVQKLNKNV